MADYIALVEKSLPSECYVYKHSTRCSVSTFTANEIQAAACTLPIYRVNVIEQRQISDWVTEHYGVKHQSPQLILIEQGKATKSWSHGEIRRDIFR